VQVIVKAATYQLKPGETDYKGTWHVEGMSHERIIASGTYTIPLITTHEMI
jgi:hypothetical protein